MERLEGLSASYSQRRVSLSLPELQKLGPLRQTQSTAGPENKSTHKNNDVEPDTSKSTGKDHERREDTKADQNTKRPEDDKASIRSGTSCRSQTSRVQSVSSKASKTSSQRLRDIELQRIQEEYELEKKIDEEKLALERKALESKERRKKKLMEAKYRAMEEAA